MKEIERLIYPVSFYRNKAVHVKRTCEQILTRYGGAVPATMEELLTLPGVGRKTANLVLILAHRSAREHLRRHARPPHLEPPRLGRDADARADRAGALRGRRPQMVAAHQSVSGDVGTERVPAGLSAVRQLRARRPLSENRRHEGRKESRRWRPRRRSEAGAISGASEICDYDASRVAFCAALLAACRRARRHRRAPGRSIVLETAKGTIEFETYPEEAPKTVAQIIALVKRNFYNGLRFHRAETGLGLVQVGDPQSRNILNARDVGAGRQREADRRGRNDEEAPPRARGGRDGLPRHRSQVG